MLANCPPNSKSESANSGVWPILIGLLPIPFLSDFPPPFPDCSAPSVALGLPPMPSPPPPPPPMLLHQHQRIHSTEGAFRYGIMQQAKGAAEPPPPTGVLHQPMRPSSEMRGKEGEGGGAKGTERDNGNRTSRTNIHKKIIFCPQ